MTDKDIQDAIYTCMWREDWGGVWVCTGDCIPCLKNIDEGNCYTMEKLFAEERVSDD